MSKHSHNKHKTDFITEVKKKKAYKIFYGIPHAHSNYSSGKGSPLSAYKYAKKKKLNFLILTDHVSFLRHALNQEDKKETKWTSLKTCIETINKKHKYFTALYGFECKIRATGDINIYNSDDLPCVQFKNLKELLIWLQEDPSRLACINHPHNCVTNILKYPELKKFITMMEVGNGSYPYKYVRFYDIFFKFLDAGWKLGAVNSQDNHRENWGDDENLTAILAENSSSKALIEALRNGRTYATESKSLKVSFYINTHNIGEIISCEVASPLNFVIDIEDKIYPIKKVQILHGNLGLLWRNRSGLHSGIFYINR